VAVHERAVAVLVGVRRFAVLSVQVSKRGHRVQGIPGGGAPGPSRVADQRARVSAMPTAAQVSTTGMTPMR
jgi:hypothetical protein